MTNDKRLGVFLGSGFMLLLLGSMPLGSYLLFLLWPNEFYHDPSTGSVPHLYAALSIGLILWLIGIVLIILGSKKSWLVLIIGLVGIGGGILISLPSFINANDYKGALGFLVTSAFGVMFAATIRMILNIYNNRCTGQLSG
jgi:hypothetical protein